MMKSAPADFMKKNGEKLKNTNHQVARAAVFFALLGIGAVFFAGAILSLLTVSKNKELYSHVPLIPFISLYFLFVGRRSIFSTVSWDHVKGLPVIAAALLAYWAGKSFQEPIPQNDYLFLMMSGVFLWVSGSFLLSFGPSALRKAAFPWLFLLFIIPLPTFLLDPFVRLLQVGSAEVTHGIFTLTGVSFHREGMFFSLPGLTIEVAEQCSGIRSSLALFITSVVAGKVFLESGWTRLALTLSVFPITMFKNALRIVMLSLLGAFVDIRFITASWLHSSGGIPFFVLALLFMAPVLWGLVRWERKKQGSRKRMADERRELQAAQQET
jgi:exosortase